MLFFAGVWIIVFVHLPVNIRSRSRGHGGDGVGDGAPILFFLHIGELDLVNNQRRIYLFRSNESIRAFDGL